MPQDLNPVTSKRPLLLARGSDFSLQFSKSVETEEKKFSPRIRFYLEIVTIEGKRKIGSGRN